jgi:hypothetical protein
LTPTTPIREDSKQVYETIDGGKLTAAHRSQEMQIQGRAFTARRAELNRYCYDAEALARARILALTEYVYRLQGE